MSLKAIHEKCSGCGTCRLACALENFREVNPSKGMLRIEACFPVPGHYRIHLCDQCGDCAAACPVEAIQPQDGIYRVDPETCTGCMTCVEACPHGVLVEHRTSDAPLKCVACGACALACPRGAIVLLDSLERGAA